MTNKTVNTLKQKETKETESTIKTFDLLSLPKDILLEVFRTVPVKDLTRCQIASKLLYKLIKFAAILYYFDFSKEKMRFYGATDAMTKGLWKEEDLPLGNFVLLITIGSLIAKAASLPKFIEPLSLEMSKNFPNS
jgi:hypothetical protein